MERIEELIRMIELEFGACPGWIPLIAAAKVELRNEQRHWRRRIYG